MPNWKKVIVSGSDATLNIVRSNVSAADTTGQLHVSQSTELSVKVATQTTDHRYYNQGSTNKYYIDGLTSPYYDVYPGKKYTFNQNDSTNDGHPIIFYLDAAKTTEYNRGVVYYADGVQANSANYDTNFDAASVRYTEIEIASTTPSILYYQCYNHSYMGNAVHVQGGQRFTAASGSFSGSFQGDGSGLTGVTATAPTPTLQQVVDQGSSTTTAITASAISSSTLTSAGDITLDADGADVILADGGTEFGRFKRDSSDFVIKSAANDKNIVFRGVDNNATVTALTLDMSESGSAIFNKDVTISGNMQARSGNFINNITASGDISASGLLFISSSESSDTAYKTVVRDPETGRLYTTGSYGGGGGGGGTTVVANPGGSPGTALTSITIGTSDFSVGGGGGGVGTLAQVTALGASTTVPITSSIISASGDFLSSGDLRIDGGIYLDSYNTITYTGRKLKIGEATNWGDISYGRASTTRHEFKGLITASGNISSSGTVFGITGSFSHLEGNSPITVKDQITFQSPVTASADVSSSGTFIGATLQIPSGSGAVKTRGYEITPSNFIRDYSTISSNSGSKQSLSGNIGGIGKVVKYIATGSISCGQPVALKIPRDGILKAEVATTASTQTELLGISLETVGNGSGVNILEEGYTTVAFETSSITSKVILNDDTKGGTASLAAGVELLFVDSGDTGGDYDSDENYQYMFDAGFGETVKMAFPSMSFEHANFSPYDRLGFITSSDGAAFANASVSWMNNTSNTNFNNGWNSSFGGGRWDDSDSVPGWILPGSMTRAEELGIGEFSSSFYDFGTRYVTAIFRSDGSSERAGWQILVKTSATGLPEPPPVELGAALYIANDGFLTDTNISSTTASIAKAVAENTSGSTVFAYIDARGI